MNVDALRLSQVPAMKLGLLVRRPPAEVFRAFTDPAITTRFWYTKSSGPVTPGAALVWEWEMHGVSTKVAVLEFEDNRRIVFRWNDAAPRTVELRFIPWQDSTYVQVTETGFEGDGDAVVAGVTGSTAGFAQVLCALKALLEHGVVLTVVADHQPAGLEL